MNQTSVESPYPHLLAPLDLGFTTLRNRTLRHCLFVQCLFVGQHQGLLPQPVYVYEVRNNTLFQVFKAENLSSYFQNVGLDISDFNQDGVADILVATSEPEWYHGDRPTGTYYHLFQYTPQQSATLFTPLPLLTPIANRKFINPQIVFSLSDCGCGGYCWFSKLYLLQGNTTQQIAEAGQYCTNMAQVYQFNEQGKTMIGATVSHSLMAGSRPCSG